MSTGPSDPEISQLLDEISNQLGSVDESDRAVLDQMSRGPTDPEIVHLLREINNNVSGGGGGTVVDTGTFTADGGSFPAFDGLLTGVTGNETATLRLDVGVDSTPPWNNDYAFNYEWGTEWDDTNLQVDVVVTVVWDQDPGAGNDLDLQYTVTSI